MSLNVYETTEKKRSRIIPGGRQLLIEPLLFPWRQRELIGVILRRELAVRFSASFFGKSWAVISPLVMLGIYLATFSVAFSAQAGDNFKPPSALSVFSSLTIFNLFMELFGRAPLLMHEHLAFIKRSLFPSSILGWIAVARALVYAAVAFALLLAAELLLTGSIPWTVLLFPFIFIPMVLFLVGMTLAMAAIGAFTRDLGHLVFSFSPILMLITPIFYSVDMLPANIQPFVFLNPIAGFSEMTRDLVVFGVVPSLKLYVLSTIGSVLVFVIGNAIFARYKDVLVDVI